MSQCLYNGPFNNTVRYGIPVLNIAAVIVFTTTLSQDVFKGSVPGWVFVVPVSYILFKLFCINTMFFNLQKTGIVTRYFS